MNRRDSAGASNFCVSPKQMKIMIRNEALLTAFAWRTADGILVPEVEMFELIKDGMSEEERKKYLSLKEKDRIQVEKGLNMAIMTELKSRKRV